MGSECPTRDISLLKFDSVSAIRESAFLPERERSTSPFLNVSIVGREIMRLFES